jgi:hypothetical protein
MFSLHVPKPYITCVLCSPCPRRGRTCTVFPRGDTDRGGADHLSLYLVGPPGLAAPLSASFCLAVVNQRDASKTVWKEATHAFSATDKSFFDPRFARFMRLDRLLSPDEGFLVGDFQNAKIQVCAGFTAAGRRVPPQREPELKRRPIFHNKNDS